jgi:hypothetical protein
LARNRKVNIPYTVYRPLIRLFVGLIILAIVNIILTSLPMVTAVQIPVFPITINAIISFVIGIIMISLLITFRREFVPRLEGATPNFKELADIVHAATNIAIIVVAYLMFDEVIMPFLKQFTWIYPLVFLALVLWPLIALVLALYKSSDKLADEATYKIAEIRGELIRCPHCAALIPSNARYCTNCSTKIGLAVTPIRTTRCAECGTENSPGDIYCLECGSPLPRTHKDSTHEEE